MKHFIATALVILTGLLTRAQVIDRVEYFWDNDPGVGHGIGSTVSAGSSVNETLSVSTNGLSAGEHLLGIRTRTDDGTWSVTSVRRFAVTGVVGAEYFWDTDPGTGNGNFLPLNTTDANLNPTLGITASGLPGGTHRLGIRTQQLGGSWSPVTWKQVTVATQFVEGEYFWDNDPGTGQATAFAANGNADGSNINVQCSSEGLESGFHNLYIRMRGANGSFGPPRKQRVYITRTIVDGEYFWDTDPGVGNGIALGTLTEGTTAQVCDAVSTVGLSPGEHYLYVRTVSEDGVWSVPSRVQMVVTESDVIVGCPGDFNRDGEITSTDILILLGNYGTSGDCSADLDGDFDVDTSDLLVLIGVYGTFCE